MTLPLVGLRCCEDRLFNGQALANGACFGIEDVKIHGDEVAVWIDPDDTMLNALVTNDDAIDSFEDASHGIHYRMSNLLSGRSTSHSEPRKWKGNCHAL